MNNGGIILHHYGMSPFSEKIRLMLGYTDLAWQSLPSPEMPPRPNLDPLTGGYRRIPVAQVGADLFCDTRLISEEIAALTNRPELSALTADADCRAYLERLESDVFWACALSIPFGVTLKQLVRNIGVWGTLRFLRDRVGVGRTARVNTPSPKRASEQFRAHLDDLERRLERDFLFGEQPSIADFCAYHTLWFQREVGALPLPGSLPRVGAWYERMTGFGHGRSEPVSRSDAFSAARDNAPRPVTGDDLDGSDKGRAVSIAPTDYALDAVCGILVASSPSRYILAREHDEFGTVHVHFPRHGFAVTRI